MRIQNIGVLLSILFTSAVAGAQTHQIRCSASGPSMTAELTFPHELSVYTSMNDITLILNGGSFGQNYRLPMINYGNDGTHLNLITPSNYLPLLFLLPVSLFQFVPGTVAPGLPFVPARHVFVGTSGTFNVRLSTASGGTHFTCRVAG
jgi:hypothetical protein